MAKQEFYGFKKDDKPKGSDDSNSEGNLATVGYGMYREDLPVDGLSVGQIREKYSNKFDMDEEAGAFVNGKPVSDDEIIEAGQVLLFTRKAGEKGS